MKTVGSEVVKDWARSTGPLASPLASSDLLFFSGHLFTGVSKKSRMKSHNWHSASRRRGDEAEREKSRGWGTERDLADFEEET